MSDMQKTKKVYEWLGWKERGHCFTLVQRFNNLLIDYFSVILEMPLIATLFPEGWSREYSSSALLSAF